jgi:DNA-binding transcriptional ArsR family regulator
VTGDKAELILHPVRLKILQAMSGDRVLSTRQLAQLLPDVAQATLYRHVQKLLQAGILVIDSEQPARGTIERFYRFEEGNATLSDAEVAALSHDDHRRYFTTFVAMLMTDFERYLQRETLDLAADGVGYHQVALHLNAAEMEEFAQSLNALVKPFLKHQPGSSDRQRILFSTILTPSD